MDQVFSSTTVRERTPNKLATTQQFNELVRALSGGVPHHPIGPRRNRWDDFFWAVVTDHGPDVLDPENPDADPAPADDFDNEQYWVRRSTIDGNDSETTDPADQTTHVTTSYRNQAVTDAENPDGIPDIIPATNTAEMYLDREEGGILAYQSGTHLVPKGARVKVWYDHDEANPPNVRYFFTQPVRYIVLVSDDAAGGGKYYGYLIRATSVAPSAAGNVALADFGVIAAAPDCLIINGAEEGQSTHDLTAGAPVSRIFPGWIGTRKSDDDPELHVVYISGYDFGPCIPP